MSRLSCVLFSIFYKKKEKKIVYLPQSVSKLNLASNMSEFSNDVSCLAEKVSLFENCLKISLNNICDTTPIVADPNYE